MPGNTEGTVSLKTLGKSVCAKLKAFIESICRKNSAGKWYIDKVTKKKHKKILFTYSDIAIANMNAGLVQVYQTCMLVGASLTDITTG